MNSQLDEKEARRLQVLGTRVMYYRRLKGMSREQLAEKIERSVSLVDRLEAPNSSVSISLRTLFRLCDALEITLSELFDKLDS